MIIDIAFAVLMLMALIRGFRRGLIVAVFSLLAVVAGLAAALKLSAVTAGYLKESVHISARWLPVLSFAVVFIVVMILVQWLGKLLEKTVNLAMLGWVNKLGGAVLFGILYTLIFSIALFYLVQLGAIRQGTLDRSVTYRVIEPLGPAVMDNIGKIFPVFQDMFAALREFFGNMAQKLS